jgi:hypothetical protein
VLLRLIRRNLSRVSYLVRAGFGWFWWCLVFETRAVAGRSAGRPPSGKRLWWPVLSVSAGTGHCLCCEDFGVDDTRF